jgi:threonine aldolase
LQADKEYKNLVYELERLRRQKSRLPVIAHGLIDGALEAFIAAVCGDLRDINMIWARVDCDGPALTAFLKERGILINEPGSMLRLVTHHDITDGGADTAANAIREFFT